eukprot:jgi/Tetstr1/466374/TSEL_010904.t1
MAMRSPEVIDLLCDDSDGAVPGSLALLAVHCSRSPGQPRAVPARSPLQPTNTQQADARPVVIDLTGSSSGVKRKKSEVVEGTQFPPGGASSAKDEVVDLTVSSPDKAAPDRTPGVPLAEQLARLNALLAGAAQAPSGPSWRENRLVQRLKDFGIEAYGFEVPLGNGVCDCVAVDAQNRLCIVEAKCMGGEYYGQQYSARRTKVVEQCCAYGRFLAQQARSDVTAYIFDDTNHMINLEEYATFSYESVKHHHVRGQPSGATPQPKRRRFRYWHS